MNAGPRSLVCVAPYLPFVGIDHAGGEFLRRYLDAAIAHGWLVRLIAPRTEENAKVEDLVEFETSLYDVETGLSARVRNLLKSGIPAPSGRTWLRRLPTDAQTWLGEATMIDLQWADSLWNAPALRERLPDAVIGGLAHDVRTESLSRTLRAGGFKPRLGAALAIPRAAAMERRSLNACDLVHVFKEADRRRLAAGGVTTRLGLMPVPVPDVSSMPEPQPLLARVLFVAAFRRSENVEAAFWFLDEVLPVLQRIRPDVKVRLAGSSPPPRLVARASESVEVTGYLETMATAYRDVSCVVVPLRRGAGVKFKTVEALEAGFPVVTTTVGAEGVEDAIAIRPTFVVDEPTAFAEAVGAVLADPVETARELRAAREGRPSRAGFEDAVAAVLESYASLR